MVVPTLLAAIGGVFLVYQVVRRVPRALPLPLLSFGMRHQVFGLDAVEFLLTMGSTSVATGLAQGMPWLGPSLLIAVLVAFVAWRVYLRIQRRWWDRRSK